MNATLVALQRDFLDAILSGSDAGAAHVCGGRLTPSERIAVYANNVASNWRGALADTHPVVLRLVGPSFFGEAARQYGLAHPSTSGDLHRFGAAFGDFLDAYPHARELAYLGDVARLEWACHRALHAADAAAFDFAALSRLPEHAYGALRLHLHPSVHLLRSDHPVEAIWHANQPDRDGTPGRDEGPDFVLVSRPGLEVNIERVERIDWLFLDALRRGLALEAAAEAMGEGGGERLGTALQHFASNATLCGFSS